MVLALLAGCTVESQVLYVADASLLLTCEEAFQAGGGAVCPAELRCTRPSGDPAGCCSEFAVCVGGQLVIDQVCSPECKPCMDDSGCPYGAATCNGERCEACPDPALCPPCDDGLVPLLRNGCMTCFCAPPSQCSGPEECGDTRTCYPGASCAEGCLPGDPGCCANVCAAIDPPCPEPAPLGCYMDCDAMPNCDACLATACECVEGRWSCSAGCGYSTAPCAFP
jgi:hypothetical protein